MGLLQVGERGEVIEKRIHVASDILEEWQSVLVVRTNGGEAIKIKSLQPFVGGSAGVAGCCENPRAHGLVMASDAAARGEESLARGCEKFGGAGQGFGGRGASGTAQENSGGSPRRGFFG